MAEKLYRVTCRGMLSGLGGNFAHGLAYVVAEDPNEAYLKLKNHLVAKNLGFESDRALQSVELMAEEGEYAPCGTRLFT